MASPWIQGRSRSLTSRSRSYFFLVFVVVSLLWGKTEGNLAPGFVPGGDMSRLSMPEDTPVGAPVYRLQGADPEGSKVHYSISGQYLAVDRDTGVVTLTRPLDREINDLLEVIISITDEEIAGSDVNTVSLRREVPVLDVNDNPPQFEGRPYSLVLSEHTKPGTLVFSDIVVTDRDTGYNSEINLKCLTGGCDVFTLSTEKIDEGKYRGVLTLTKPLDYESQSSFSLEIEASDSSPDQPLSISATIAISVTDFQDQPPIFLNAPYSATLQENTSPGHKVVDIKVRDGDLGDSRPIVLTIEDDVLHYFSLRNSTVVTSNIPIDREHPIVIQNGGVYSFRIKATELINNELPGDYTYERVTAVITDVDDQTPRFNKPNFEISVSEDITPGTPLPGLNMGVSDDDVGENAKYTLSLRFSDPRVHSWFTVEPKEALGRTPVVVRMKDNAGFDFDSNLRKIGFTVVAFIRDKKGNLIESSHSDVTVNVLDANDNSPIFSQASYTFTIPENLATSSKIANITASDIDSGSFGTLRYTLRGFGMDKFGTDSINGNLYLTGRVDYEKEKSYSLSLEAQDGGGRVSTVPLLVSLTDINDNPPLWESNTYHRTVREGATIFQPQFVLTAKDADKDGESKIKYQIVASNSDVLVVDEDTGEIKITSPVSSSHTSRGQYELVIRAFDDGSPALHSDTAVFVRVGVPGNQRPIFRDTPYNVSLKESANKGDVVIRVRATDPDGSDSAIKYKISNGADNFNVDESTGVVTVSNGAILDPDVTSSRRYNITVLAIDSGAPIRETAQTVVTVNIIDVNNKPPHFPTNGIYVRHLSERTEIGTPVLRVAAVDPDMDHRLKYTITDFRAMQKSGVPLVQTTSYNFKNVFKINETSGDIILNSPLNQQSAAVIILIVEAVDLNAAVDADKQKAKVEVSIYVEAFDEEKPQFLVGGWTGADPWVRGRLEEELPIGSMAFQMFAVDPRTNNPVTNFRMAGSSHALALDSAGKIITTNRIDYEAMDDKVITFSVEAVSNDGLRTSEAFISLTVVDINDHSPTFEQELYKGEVVESAPKGTFVLSVKATDQDEANTTLGYGDIRYSLSGDNSNLFVIDPITGDIKVSGNGEIDREKQSVLRVIAVASDTPQGGANQRKSVIPINIEVKDINDNPPVFSSPEYTSVVLENVTPGTWILNISATDNDIGPAGTVEYELVNEAETSGLFWLSRESGELRTKKELTGKGRKESYRLTVRAQDLGTPSRFTDVPLNLYIGDVVSNDGVPTFLHPTLDQIAYISENSSVGSPVFRVVVTDPDDPNTMEGQVRYSFLQDGGDSQVFNIDPITGLITTKKMLDREEKDRYNLILVAQDAGLVPQKATRQLRVVVSDIDDHKPVFNRSLDSQPVEYVIQEEMPPGSQIGILNAIDPDDGENADIGYLITYGNEDGLFKLTRLPNNSAALTVQSRLDREQNEEYLITVKCFKLSLTPSSLRKIYNKLDLSERLIKIKLTDVDDNLPEFVDSDITIGVRVNVPIDTLLLTVSASDVDETSLPIRYFLDRVTFIPPSSSNSQLNSSANLTSIFTLDNITGELRTQSNLAEFHDGHFEIRVAASNKEDGNCSYALVKIFIVRDRGLMKFVFSQPPGEVKMTLPHFKQAMEEALGIPVSLNVYDTQFHSKTDGSLDFSSTSSCFQLVGTKIFDIREMESLLTPQVNPKIDEIYKQFGVQSVQRCAPLLLAAEVTWVQFCVLGIAGFIGIASFISGCVLCCTYRRW